MTKYRDIISMTHFVLKYGVFSLQWQDHNSAGLTVINICKGVGEIDELVFRRHDLKIYIQPRNFAYIRLLNKPYENEVTLTKLL